MVCGMCASHSLVGKELSTPERIEMKCLLNTGWFIQHCCIVALVDVRWHESKGASVAAYGQFEFTRMSFVVEYMPSMMGNVLVGIDEVCSFVGF